MPTTAILWLEQKVKYITLRSWLTNQKSWLLKNLVDIANPDYWTVLKDEAQTALFKDPVRTAQ